MADDAATEELAVRATSLTADPLMLPTMAVRATIEAGLVSRLVWIFPSKTDPEELNVEQFRQQMLESGMASEEEAANLTLHKGQFSGTIAGKPFQALTIAQLPAIEKPILLHIDLTYFQSVYKGEIKTPLYPLLGTTLTALKKQNWPTLAVSISFSCLEGGVPLASRFVGRDLGAIFKHPEYLNSSLPEQWDSRSRALYLENFFQKEKMRKIYLEMEQNTPSDPSIQFALYDLSRQFKEGDKALEYLRKAVEADPVYALEYLNLAKTAQEKQLPDQVFRMLGLAQSTFTENPFIALNLAQAHLQAGQKNEAKIRLKTLSDMHWSKVYYPDLSANIQQISEPASGQ